MLLAPVRWAGCVWGLPFLTVLAPSERHAAGRFKRHKTPTDWGQQALLQVARRLPGRRVIAVAGGSFAAIALLRDLAPHIAVVTRPRLDARLCRPPPPRRPGAIGRLPAKGARLPGLAQRRRDPATRWRRVTVRGWYGRITRRLDITTGTALWHYPGMRVAIRWGPGQCPERCATRAARRRRGPSSAPTYTPTPPYPALVRPTSPSCAPRRRSSRHSPLSRCGPANSPRSSARFCPSG